MALPPPLQQGPPPPPAPRFALTPAALQTALFIDLNSPEGRKSFTTAIKPLDDPYDGTKTKLQMFIHQVATRASICGWYPSIMTIPTAGNAAVTHSLITEYGQIPITDITTHAAGYLTTQTKAAQDSMALKLFLDSSLTTTLMMRVLAKRHEYTINGVESGPAMFRIILSLVGLDTVASVAVINATLRTLKEKLVELKSDIVAFNEFVTEQCNELVSRGQQPADLVHLLFEAYLSTNNEHFKDYIRSKEDAVYEGLVVLTYQTLMTIAEDKYKIMKIKGEWKVTKAKATPTVDEHIIALRAEIQAITTNRNEASRTTGTNSNTSNSARRANTGKWAWKDIAPKTGDSLHKKFEGRMYCHCPHHKSTKWVLADKHKDGCTLDETWKFPGENDKAGATAKKGEGQTYQRALMHVITEDEAASMAGEEENI